MKYLLVLLALGGCGDDGGPPPPSKAPATGTYQSGSRLRAHFWDAGGGATVFQDWHDNQLNVPCTFNLADDGAWRCLPTGDSAFTFHTPPMVFFDAGCTQPAVDSLSQTVPAWATFQENPCAGEVSPMHVYQIDPRLHTPAMVYTLSGSSCTGAPPPAGHYYFLLTPADVSAFARADLVVENRGALDVEVLVADDDTRQLGRILDHKRAKVCQPEFDDNHCLPADLAPVYGEYYSAPDCSGSGDGLWACTVGSNNCPAPSTGIRATKMGCMTTNEIITAGPTIAQSFYRDQNNQCVPVMIGGGCMFAPASSSVALGTFPTIATASVGTGRITRTILTTPNDTRELSEHELYDTQLSANCGVHEFSDNVRRCASGTAAINDFGLTWFADLSCTQPLVAASSDPCQPNPSYAVRLYQANNVIYEAVIDKLYAVGAPFGGSTVYRVDPQTGNCVTGTPQGTFLMVGAQLDPDSVFARMTERTD